MSQQFAHGFALFRGAMTQQIEHAGMYDAGEPGDPALGFERVYCSSSKVLVTVPVILILFPT
jgi:hypothetical protein